MKRLEFRGWRRAGSDLFFILAGVLLLTYVDVVVVDRIIVPIVFWYPVPWSAFQLAGGANGLLIWHTAFIPLAIGFFGLLAMANKNWRLAAGGTLLFFGGWEDLLFFLIQLKPIPQNLAWLDNSLLVFWTKFLTQTDYVTNVGLWIAAGIIGVIAVVVVIIRFKPPR